MRYISCIEEALYIFYNCFILQDEVLEETNNASKVIVTIVRIPVRLLLNTISVSVFREYKLKDIRREKQRNSTVALLAENVPFELVY